MKTLLVVTADWCGYCKRFQPVLNSLYDFINNYKIFNIVHIESTRNADNIKQHNQAIDDLINGKNVETNIYYNNYTDTDKFQKLPNYYIKSFPTILLIEDNKILGKYTGNRTVKDIVNYVLAM